MSTELIVVEKEKALELFTKEKGLDPVLAEIRKSIDEFVPNVETSKGRKEIASMARKVASSKTYLEKMGKELSAELKKKIAPIDAERKRVKDLLDKWKIEVRKPLTDFEAAEERRVEEVRSKLDQVKSMSLGIEELDSNELELKLKEINEFEVNCDLGEFEETFISLKESATLKIENALLKRRDYEKEQEEIRIQQEKEAEQKRLEEERIAKEKEEERIKLEKEQKEKEEKERVEREKKLAEEARIKAEEKAKKEKEELERKAQEEKERLEREKREAIEKAEREKKEAAEKAEAERIRLEKEKQEAIEKERQKIEAEKAREQEEIRKREADIAHRKKINNEALVALVENCGISEEEAKGVVSAIAAKLITNVTINY